MDIILYSGGAVGFQELMAMPVPSIQILINQMNKKAEDQKKANKG